MFMSCHVCLKHSIWINVRLSKKAWLVIWFDKHLYHNHTLSFHSDCLSFFVAVTRIRVALRSWWFNKLHSLNTSCFELVIKKLYVCELLQCWLLHASTPKLASKEKESWNFQTICSAIRDVLGIEGPDSKRTIYLPPRDHLATFLEAKAILGPHSDSLEFEPLPSWAGFPIMKLWWFGYRCSLEDTLLLTWDFVYTNIRAVP